MNKNIVNIVKALLPKGGFARNAMTMMAGTAIAQMIGIAFSPILTRLYSPDEFGLFALFVCISSMVSICVTGRYDLPIMLPESDEDAASLFTLSVFIMFFVICILTISIALWGDEFASIITNKEISKWLYLIPLSVFITGSYNIFSVWTTRQKKFITLARNRVLNSSIISLINLFMGILKTGASGLIVGTIIGQATAACYLAWNAAEKIKRFFKTDIKGIIHQARRYSRFPIYSLPADFMNVAAQQIPVLMLSFFYDSIIVGFFSLTQRVLSIPLTFISQSLSSVFQERASRDFNELGNCKDIYQKTFKGLILVSILPFAIFFFSAPWLFSIIFGAQWHTAGIYAQILTPLLFLRFIASPLSYVLYITEKQNYDLIGQFFLVTLSTGSIFLGFKMYHSPQYTLIILSASASIVYLTYILCSYHLSKGKPYERNH